MANMQVDARSCFYVVLMESSGSVKNLLYSSTFDM